MGFASHLYHRVPTGRRGDPRLRLTLPAELITLNGQGAAQIENLSLSGARVATHLALNPGSSCLLRWLDQEVFAIVKWARNNRCGLIFDEHLSEDTLLRTRNMEAQAQRVEEERWQHSARDFVNGRGRGSISD